jgi:hypothetical protein
MIALQLNMKAGRFSRISLRRSLGGIQADYELSSAEAGPDPWDGRIGHGCDRCFFPLRQPHLRAAGWALVVNETIAPADIIVISPTSGGAGVLEAADLVQSGISKRVAVFMDPPSGDDYEFIRRGLPYEDQGARQIRQLKSLGVTDVVQIPRTYVGTESEGQVLPPWCDENQLRSIVFVAAKDHSRRVRRVLDRAMKGHPVRVTVQPARYSTFDPDRWWETRDCARTEIVELQKLLLDFVLHPLSYLDTHQTIVGAAQTIGRSGRLEATNRCLEDNHATTCTVSLNTAPSGGITA